MTVYKIGDFLLPRTQFPDDHYRIVSLDAYEARVQALHGSNALREPKTLTLLTSQLPERFAQVMCKRCGKKPATVLHGPTLTAQEHAENKAWADSFKDGWHTGHCPHLELPQQPRCMSCHEG